MLPNNTVIIFLAMIRLSTSLSEEVSSDSSSEDVDPLVEFIAGVLIFLLSFPILWYNEYK
jgi:hypothetical protein